MSGHSAVMTVRGFAEPSGLKLYHKGIIMSGVGDTSTLPTSRGDGREVVTAVFYVS